jgi:hypothetical protein
MNAFEYILSKQVLWARNNKIALIGSKGKHGRPVYTTKLKDNLFEPLTSEVKKDFDSGDGGELIGNPPKMSALHSSSAIGVNIFQYWLKVKQVPKIAAACGFCSKNNNDSQNIRFEQKYSISNKFRYSPNIDVVIENSSESRFKIFAIECKFSEAYSSRMHSGLKQKYLQLDEIWGQLPNLHVFAKSISPEDKKFNHLHPAQLVKHILGLTKGFGKNKFRLLYLWYDCLGYEGAKHRDEIEEFINVTKKDNISFHALSYQELISKLSNGYRIAHKRYVNYIGTRYL